MACFSIHFGVCLCLALRHELWINLRRETHSEETWPPVGYKGRHSPLTDSSLYTQTRSTNCHPPPLQDGWAVLCRTKQGTGESQTLASPQCFGSLLLCHAVLSIIQSDISTCPSPFLRDGRQRCRRSPGNLAPQGSGSHCSIANHGVGCEGYSHTLTHWQRRTVFWDIICQNVEDWLLSLLIHSHTMFTYRSPLIWCCLFASYFGNGCTHFHTTTHFSSFKANILWYFVCSNNIIFMLWWIHPLWCAVENLEIGNQVGNYTFFPLSTQIHKHIKKRIIFLF